jgi:hypothetical protein
VTTPKHGRLTETQPGFRDFARNDKSDETSSSLTRLDPVHCEGVGSSKAERGQLPRKHFDHWLTCGTPVFSVTAGTDEISLQGQAERAISGFALYNSKLIETHCLAHCRSFYLDVFQESHFPSSNKDPSDEDE